MYSNEAREFVCNSAKRQPQKAGICACLFAVQIMLHQKLLAIEGNFNYIIIMRTRFGCALLSIDFEVLSYFNSRTVGRPPGQQSVAVTSL